MGKWLIRHFIKDADNVRDPAVRHRYSILAGIVGIVTNTLLCLAKIGIGLALSSIAILADGINNLTDASSSVILLVGTKLSAKPADADHPYGHARIEYITGLIISLLIILVGFQLLLGSVRRIMEPVPVAFDPLSAALLIVAIGVKIWQSLFYRYAGKAIDSTTLKASAADSRNDVITTGAVLASLIAGTFTTLPVDGLMGTLVALFIIYAGIRLVLEASTPLVGAAPDPQLVEEIRSRILSHKDVLGIHDLVVHNYGPGRSFASVHIEVDGKGDLIASHDTIDTIEREVARDLGIQVVAHMDPLDIHDPLTATVREQLDRIAAEIPGIREIHDLRVVAGYTHQNIIFDVLIGPDCPLRDKDLKELFGKKVQALSPNWFAVVTVDRSYTP